MGLLSWQRTVAPCVTISLEQPRVALPRVKLQMIMFSWINGAHKLPHHDKARSRKMQRDSWQDAVGGQGIGKMQRSGQGVEELTWCRWTSTGLSAMENTGGPDQIYACWHLWTTNQGWSTTAAASAITSLIKQECKANKKEQAISTRKVISVHFQTTLMNVLGTFYHGTISCEVVAFKGSHYSMKYIHLFKVWL